MVNGKQKPLAAGTVLVVEDDEAIRILLAELLETHGWKVLTAENGEEALQVLEAMDRPPCVIFLDLMMPVMNGWGFLSECEIRGLVPKVPIVVLSALGRAVDFARQIIFLHKPVGVEEILKLCEQKCPLSVESKQSKEAHEAENQFKEDE